jgi:hypothetical protein
MSNNPLQRYFRRPALWVKLPTLGRWYNNGEVEFNDRQEVEVYGITAIDEILLNTPDALFNGHALETVIVSCVPSVKDVKSLTQPDLDALFVGIKSATTNGKFEINKRCEKCQHDNTFEIQCNHLLDNMTYVEESDTIVDVDSDIRVHIKPYDFAMRSMLILRQLEERKVLGAIEDDDSIENNLEKADLFAKSIEKMSRLTFRLVADSITSIEVLGKDQQYVVDKDYITEWLTNINKQTADTVISAVSLLNQIGPVKTSRAQCDNCGHQWDEVMNFDPALFFSRR